MPMDFRPNINIPTNAFQHQNDPYSQILPGLIQGREAGYDLRKRQLLQGLFKDSPELNAIAQADPSMAMQIYMQQMNRAPAYMGSNGQLSPTPGQGAQPFGMMDRGEMAKLMTSQQEHAATLAEQQRAHQESEENRRMQMQIMQLLGNEGVAQRRQGQEMQNELGKQGLQQKVDAFKGQHWIANMMPWTQTSKMRGPYDPEVGAPVGRNRLKVTNVRVTGR